MVLQQKPLEKADFIVKITGPVMVRLASSDKWKAPYINKKSFSKLFLSKKKKDTAQWRIQGRGPGGPPPLIFDQNEARRTEKIFLGDRLPLS